MEKSLVMERSWLIASSTRGFLALSGGAPPCHQTLHLLTVLVVDGARDYVPSIRNFDPLPDAVREQASWGRLLSDPEWGNYIDSREGPRLIPFIDITDDYERSVA